MAADGLEFDWDDANIGHLRRHGVSATEFEQVLRNGPLELEYQNEGVEERYKALGVTDRGRALVIVWIVRSVRHRAVTAYPAGRPLRKLFNAYEGTQ